MSAASPPTTLQEVNLKEDKEKGVDTPPVTSSSPPHDLPKQSSEPWTLRRVGRAVRGIFPWGFKQELKELFILAWPVVLSQFFSYSIIFVSLIFSGRVLGKAQLDGVAIGVTFINLTGVSVGFGLTFALDTLLSQTFGGANKKRVGIIIQRGTIIVMLFCLPCWALYLNTETIMKAIKLPPDVANLAGIYVIIFIPGLPGLVLLQIINKYMQNQNLVMPPLWIGAIMNVINVALHAIFLFGFKWNVAGASVACGASFWIGCIISVCYMKIRRIHEETWGGWSMECLQEWGLFTKLAVPGLIMMGIEFWNYELGTLLSGLLGKDDLAAQTVCYTMATIAFMTPVGLGVAGSIRIGQYLGANQPRDAHLASRVCMLLALCIAGFTSLLVVIFNYYIPQIFTPDKKVIGMASGYLLILSISCFFDGCQGVLSGILRGCGLQKIGAIVNFVGFFCIGFPIGLPLMLRTQMRVAGYWWGNCVATFVQAVCFTIIIIRLDWNKFAEKAQVRAGIKKKGDKSAEDVQPTAEDEKAAEANLEAKSNGVAEGDKTTFEMDVEQPPMELTSVEKHLPLKQLIINRSIAVLVCVGFLVIGIILSITVKIPDPPPKCLITELQCLSCTVWPKPPEVTGTHCSNCYVTKLPPTEEPVEGKRKRRNIGEMFHKNVNKMVKNLFFPEEITYDENYEPITFDEENGFKGIPNTFCYECEKSGGNSDVTLDCNNCTSIAYGPLSSCNVNYGNEACSQRLQLFCMSPEGARGGRFGKK
ncbi:unnamed protein product [Owenia fusiformis]|uniref:Multidrug and toxin extrusion protein n=1 Tax=Owenia fusiformis TaxID=6347 RepID=A0A8S4ND17_OWEFU|nr:unnamed protein product [Owenia fusiformis]